MRRIFTFLNQKESRQVSPGFISRFVPTIRIGVTCFVLMLVISFMPCLVAEQACTNKLLSKPLDQMTIPQDTGSANVVIVKGRLTDEGVECQALRANSGELYTLTGNLRRFKVGDKVRVIGEVVEYSFCMQGTTLSVINIRRTKLRKVD
jgi:hypothetical protein